MKECFLAIDLGATSGRLLLADKTAITEMEEIHRFPNHIIETNGHYYWDIYELYRNIIEGLKLVADRKNVNVCSIGIDTWGVDFVMIGKDGHLLRQPYSYRDPYTIGAPEIYFERMDRSMVYTKTGIQVMNFNSLFQLDTLRRNHDSALAIADKILFIPDVLMYMLTGEMVTEYTIATTAQLVNAHTRRLDIDLLKSVGLDESHFGRFVYPGEKVGCLSAEVQCMTGLGAIPLIAVAEHDTGSAVAAIPSLNEKFAYLSSGTWSLMGVETKQPVITAETELLNFTNEGGVEHTIRLLKNICGMWLLERCRQVWGEIPYQQLVDEASLAEPFRSVVNPDDATFANPVDMAKAIQHYCAVHQQPVPETRGQIVRCIYESLALRYKDVLENLRCLSPVEIEVLHVIGGGARNELLNQFTANAIGMKVVAGPYEATGLGNVMVQALSAGADHSIWRMRKMIHESLPLKTYLPKETEIWQKAYLKYRKNTQ